MPVPGYAEFVDSEGNPIEGSVQVAGREGMVEIQEFDHDVRIPTDEAKGELMGVRQHRPATLTKPYDKASPLLYDALCNGETLQEVKVHWYTINKTGEEVEYFTHTLKEAKISKIQSFMPETKNPQKEQFGHHERVHILYSKITWLFQDGNIEYTDAWTAER